MPFSHEENATILLHSLVTNKPKKLWRNLCTIIKSCCHLLSIPITVCSRIRVECGLISYNSTENKGEWVTSNVIVFSLYLLLNYQSNDQIGNISNARLRKICI